MRGAKARKRARDKRTEREFFKNRTEAQRRSKFGVASVVIERVFRGHAGRKLAQLRRLERAEEAAKTLIMRHKKAARIQSMFKGYRFRNEIRISRRRERVVNASIALQKVVRGHFGRVLVSSVVPSATNHDVSCITVTKINPVASGSVQTF